MRAYIKGAKDGRPGPKVGRLVASPDREDEVRLRWADGTCSDFVESSDLVEETDAPRDGRNPVRHKFKIMTLVNKPTIM